jgi:NAD(P)-dependent dehydrogenase (short-subunit alcohol dehydrogenase family)
MDFGLKGKVALVTGAGRGVGREIALVLAREGAHVGVNYFKSRRGADEVVAECRRTGVKAQAYGADVSDYQAAKELVERAIAELGGLDILVNNAGHSKLQLFVESGPEDWKSTIGVCLYGVIHCTHAALPHFTARKAGRLINIVGDSGRVGEARLAVTAAGRAGAIAFTKSMAREMARFNITANAVALGLVETEHMDPAWLAAKREKILPLYPLRRLGQPGDVAPIVAFLASDGASWITGQTISVSGGYTTVG